MSKRQSIAIILLGYALMLYGSMVLGVVNDKPIIAALGAIASFVVCYPRLIKLLEQWGKQSLWDINISNMAKIIYFGTNGGSGHYPIGIDEPLNGDEYNK